MKIKLEKKIMNLKDIENLIDKDNSVSVNGKLPIIAELCKISEFKYSFVKGNNRNHGYPDGYLTTFKELF